MRVVASSCIVPQAPTPTAVFWSPVCMLAHRTFTDRCVSIAGSVAGQSPIAERIVSRAQWCC